VSEYQDGTRIPDMKPVLKAAAHRTVGNRVAPTEVAKRLFNRRRALADIISTIIPGAVRVGQRLDDLEKFEQSLLISP
jgi:hypothetical protein